jgi:hypothetical protein
MFLRFFINLGQIPAQKTLDLRTFNFLYSFLAIHSQQKKRLTGSLFVTEPYTAKKLYEKY